MKNFIIVGLTALLLFSVSAGLSVYLQQAKPTAEDDSKKKKKSDGAGDKDSPSKTPAGAADRGASKSPSAEPDVLGAEARATDAGLTERKKRLDEQIERFDVIQRDIRLEREALQKLVTQVMAEMKRVQALMADVESKSAEAESIRQATAKLAADNAKKTAEYDANERASFVKLATMYEGMTPESAAGILQQLADTGKMDTAVKILGQMKEAKAAKVISEVETKDKALAAQLIDKMRTLKRPPPPGPG